VGFWTGKNVAVPGGAGFIGSYVVDNLAARGASVTVVDNLETGRLENLRSVLPAIRFLEGDVTDLELCCELFEGTDVVMNLAAAAPGVGVSHRQHVELLGRNLLISSSVLEAARRRKVRRCLVVSSSCVYPDDAPVPTPELPTFTGEPERVNSGYGWAKRYIELQAQHYAAQFGLEIALARPFNAYGARDVAAGERSHVIPALIERLLSDEPQMTLWGDGCQTRSFIHGRDVAEALCLLTERYAVCDPVNVGHDRETRLRDLAGMLMELTGIRKEVVYDTSKPTGCLRKSADIVKLRQVTGAFEPRMDFREGLREMIEAHRTKKAKA